MTNLLLSCFLSIFLPLANTPDNQGVETSDTDSVSVSIAPFYGNARAALTVVEGKNARHLLGFEENLIIIVNKAIMSHE